MNDNFLFYSMKCDQAILKKKPKNPQNKQKHPHPSNSIPAAIC